MGLSLFCCFIASTGDHPNGLVYLDPIPYTSVNKITFVLKKETALNLSPLFSYVGWDNTLRFEQIGRHLSNDIFISVSLHWRHNDQDGVSNHQPVGCLLNRLFRRGSKKTPKLRVTGLWGGIHRDWWIPHTKGQLRGKCFHLMTSPCPETSSIPTTTP